MQRITFLLLLLISLQARSQEIGYTVHFDVNAAILPDSAMIFLVKMIHAGAVYQVELEGHCDSVGSIPYNKQLSNQRVNAVAKLLLQNGLNESQITRKIGYGKLRPLNANASETDRWENRRVEVRCHRTKPGKESVVVKPPASARSTNDSSTRVKPLKQSHSIPKIVHRIELATEEVDTVLLQEGNSLIFQNLLFEPGRHVWKPEAVEVLSSVLEMLQLHSSLELEIQGHVCCTSTEADGYDWDTGLHNLSEARALAVYQFFVQNGIESERLSYKGYGGSRKISWVEDFETDRRKNRRVEFRIVRR